MAGVLAVVAALVSGPATLAADAGTDAARVSATVVKEAEFTSGVADGWAAVERYRDTRTGFVAETYPADGRGDQVGQVATHFGSARPHSSRFLLYAGPRHTGGIRRSPVLLVHGANQTASGAWANPAAGGNFGCGRVFCPRTGMMQKLTADGHQVYAIGFPHRNGDGYYWAQQIGDAVDVIKDKTGATTVDVVGWSKGAFNARQYVSSVRQPWGAAYAGGVGRLVLLGGPNLGFDWGYRHGISHDAAVFPECGGKLNAPAANRTTTCWYVRRTHPELSYESAAFPGSAQMLARWDHTYPLPPYEQDWYTTYYGGTGFLSAGTGIEAAMAGRSLVTPIVAAGTPAAVRVYLVCGTAPTMPGLHNEHTGPSDGAVFVRSCSARDGIRTVGGVATPALNHLELGYAGASVDQVAAWLR